MFKMTKSSSSKKRRSGWNASKLSIMRKKLTLKSRTSPAPHETLVKEEVAHAESTTEDVNKEEESFNEDNKEEEQAIVLSQVKAKKLLQRASPMKLVGLYPSISEEQEIMIRNADYGGLLDIKCSKLQPELCKFLMESFDPVSCMMVFPGRGAIPVTEGSVQKVIGVPRGKLEVRYEVDVDATRFMKEQLGNGVRKQPTVTSLKKKLVSMKKADSKYLRLFITFGMCSVLAPTMGTRISPRLYPSLVNVKQANHLNVCKFVIMMIRKATKSKSEKAILKSCMLYLMVKYLDSLQLKDMHVSEEGTRVSAWSNAMVKKAIAQDTRSDGSFGIAPLKPEFANINTHMSPDKDEDGYEQEESQHEVPPEQEDSEHEVPPEQEESELQQLRDILESILLTDSGHVVVHCFSIIWNILFASIELSHDLHNPARGTKESLSSGRCDKLLGNSGLSWSKRNKLENYAG